MQPSQQPNVSDPRLKDSLHLRHNPRLFTERAWLVEALPESAKDIEPTKSTRYFLTKGLSDGVQISIVKEGEAYYQHVVPGGWPDHEKKISLTEEQFRALVDSIPGTPHAIEKLTYKIPTGNTLVHVDRYTGDLDGIITARARFTTEAEALMFDPPSWCQEDLPPPYNELNFALNGRPRQIGRL